MTRFIFGILFLATIAYSAAKRVHNPDGNLILDAKLGYYVNSKKTFKVDRIEGPSNNISYPPGLVPIGGVVAVMPNIAGTWTPPADCNTIIDGFMRAGYGGVACKVPKSCKDCVLPVDTTLPLLNNSIYIRGNDTSNVAGGNNNRTPTQNMTLTINDHTHLHTVSRADISNSLELSYNLPAHTHSPANITYSMDHTHGPNTFYSINNSDQPEYYALGGNSNDLTHNHAHSVVESSSALLTAGMYKLEPGASGDRSIAEYAANSSGVGIDQQHVYGDKTLTFRYEHAVRGVFRRQPGTGVDPANYNYGLRVRGKTGKTTSNYDSYFYTPSFLVSLFTDIFQQEDRYATGYIGNSLNPSECNGDTGAGEYCITTVGFNPYDGSFNTSTYIQEHSFNLSSVSTNNEPSYISVIWVVRVK